MSVDYTTNYRRPAPFPAFPAFCFLFIYNKVERERPRVSASDQRRRADHPEGRRRMPGANHWPRVPVFWGLHPEGRRARVPHVGTGNGFRAPRTGARLAAPGVPIGGKCTQNGCKTGKNAMKWGFLEPRRRSAGAYLQGIQGARAGTRRVGWRLLSRANRAFSSDNLT